MGTLYGIDGALLECQYRNHLSGYLHWDQLAHAQDWLFFEKNIGAYVCIDEVALSRGELYTILTNKVAHGGKDSIIGVCNLNCVSKANNSYLLVADTVQITNSLALCYLLFLFSLLCFCLMLFELFLL